MSKMSASDDPAHKAMLFFLEVLMNSNGPLTISQLAGRFGSRSFSNDMRNACGGNESGLKKFLQKYPSLFLLKGNVVSLFDGRQTSSPTPSSSGISTPDSSRSSSSGMAVAFSTPARMNGSTAGVTLRPLPDVTTEMAAVQYFQCKLWKKEDGWMPIRSLAGHLSQASNDIRNVVGPQLEFKAWLMRHPHIFVVQGDAVRLQDGMEALVTHPGGRPLSMSDITMFSPPKPMQSKRKSPPASLSGIQRSRSIGEKMAAFIGEELSDAAGTQSNQSIVSRKRSNFSINASEYKALVYLKDVLEKNGPMKLHSLTVYLSKASESIQNAVGWTKMEMEDFLRKHVNIFLISSEEIVSLNRESKPVVTSTAGGSYLLAAHQNGRTLCGQGKIYHVAKLWGIIDLGKHEHVFFDRSIMKRPIDDMQKEFHVGEMLCFSAVLAPKTSRSKWRAEQVWKEHEQQPSLLPSELSCFSTEAVQNVIEDEINRFLPDADDDCTSEELLDGWIESPVTGGAGPATPSSPPRSSFSIVDKGHCNGEENGLVCSNSDVSLGVRHSIPHLSKTDDSASLTKLDNMPKKTATFLASQQVVSVDEGKKVADVACQTISTGSIISTQFYHES